MALTRGTFIPLPHPPMVGDNPAARSTVCVDVGLVLARWFLPVLVVSLERQLSLSTPSPAHRGPANQQPCFPASTVLHEGQRRPPSRTYPAPILSFIRACQHSLYSDAENPKQEDQRMSVHFKFEEHRRAPLPHPCSVSYLVSTLISAHLRPH